MFKKSRIDELVDQCENWYETSEGFDLDFDYSKFARLIIEDCSKAWCVVCVQRTPPLQPLHAHATPMLS